MSKLNYKVTVNKKKEEDSEISPLTAMSMQKTVNQAITERLPTGHGGSAASSASAPQSQGYGRSV